MNLAGDDMHPVPTDSLATAMATKVIRIENEAKRLTGAGRCARSEAS